MPSLPNLPPKSRRTHFKKLGVKNDRLRVLGLDDTQNWGKVHVTWQEPLILFSSVCGDLVDTRACGTGHLTTWLVCCHRAFTNSVPVNRCLLRPWSTFTSIQDVAALLNAQVNVREGELEGWALRSASRRMRD